VGSKCRRCAPTPGWKAERLRDKGRYVHFEGDRRERKALRAALKYEAQPYPKRRRPVRP
jgi:hypothetical protein